MKKYIFEPFVDITKGSRSFIPKANGNDVDIANLQANTEVSQEDVLALKESAYNEGYNTAKGEYEQIIAHKSTHIEGVLENVKSTLETVVAEQKHYNTNQYKEIASLALAIAKKVVGASIQNNIIAQIEQGIYEAMAQNNHQKLTVFVHPTSLTTAIEKLDSLIQTNNMEIKADETLTADGHRIAWHNGFMLFEPEKLLNDIEKLFEY
jgi:flagellar biosynthesis/type III secretory pathway protein FliH